MLRLSVSALSSDLSRTTLFSSWITTRPFREVRIHLLGILRENIQAARTTLDSRPGDSTETGCMTLEGCVADLNPSFLKGCTALERATSLLNVALSSLSVDATLEI